MLGERESAKKRIGQTNPPRRKPKATIELGRVLPHVADGSVRLCPEARRPSPEAGVALTNHGSSALSPQHSTLRTQWIVRGTQCLSHLLVGDIRLSHYENSLANCWNLCFNRDRRGYNCTTALRRELEHWFDAEDIRPAVVGEFDDSALLKVFGQAGAGLFAVPDVIEKEVRRQYGVRVVGRIASVQERFYAISVERKVKHPAVVAIADAAREKLFG